MPFVWLRILCLLLALVVVPLALLLFSVAVSLEARVFAVGGVLIGLGPLLICIGKERESNRTEWAGLLACLVWVLTMGWLAVRAPAGTVSDEKQARIQHRFVKEGQKFKKHAPGNLLPELDQLLLGFRLVPWVDPLLTSVQSKHLAELTTGIYQELEADADFHALGSVLPMAYDDLIRGQTDHGHYLLYVPRDLPKDRPAPALVFLHGSGGNFKAYPWLLSKVADKLGMVLVCPSYGLGKWEPKSTVTLVRLALADAGKVVPLDSKQVHLMALSNGGLGASYLARDLGERFKSMTLISPVMEKEFLDSAKFAARWKEKPVFVITGGQDDRVPADYVQQGVELMQRRRANVTFRSVAGADHFLLFSHRNEVVEQLIGWLREVSKAESFVGDQPAVQK